MATATRSRPRLIARPVRVKPLWQESTKDRGKWKSGEFFGSCFRMRIVRPIGRFDRNDSLAVPEQYEMVGATEDREHLIDWLHRAQDRVIAYNNRARSCRWSTWAIVECVEERFAVIEDCKKFEASFGAVDCRLRSGLLRHVVQVELKAQVVVQPGDDIRTAAIAALRQQLAALEGGQPNSLYHVIVESASRRDLLAYDLCLPLAEAMTEEFNRAEVTNPSGYVARIQKKKAKGGDA